MYPQIVKFFSINKKSLHISATFSQITRNRPFVKTKSY